MLAPKLFLLFLFVLCLCKLSLLSVAMGSPHKGQLPFR